MVTSLIKRAKKLFMHTLEIKDLVLQNIRSSMLLFRVGEKTNCWNELIVSLPIKMMSRLCLYNPYLENSNQYLED